MSPKEKSIELRDKMKSCLFSDGLYDAKQCALIAVDEMLDFMILTLKWPENNNCNVDFWQEVKQEIERL